MSDRKRRLPFGSKKYSKVFKGETWQQKRVKLAESEVSLSTPPELVGEGAQVVDPATVAASPSNPSSSVVAGASLAGPVVSASVTSTPVTSTPVASTTAPSTSVVTSMVTTPTVVSPETASIRKLTPGTTVKGKAQVISDSECVGKGNRVISVEALSQFVCLVRCPGCDTQDLSISEGVGNRRGLVTKLVIECNGCEWKHTLTDPYSRGQGAES